MFGAELQEAELHWLCCMWLLHKNLVQALLPPNRCRGKISHIPVLPYLGAQSYSSQEIISALWQMEVELKVNFNWNWNTLASVILPIKSHRFAFKPWLSPFWYLAPSWHSDQSQNMPFIHQSDFQTPRHLIHTCGIHLEQVAES